MYIRTQPPIREVYHSIYNRMTCKCNKIMVHTDQRRTKVPKHPVDSSQIER